MKSVAIAVERLEAFSAWQPIVAYRLQAMRGVELPAFRLHWLACACRPRRDAHPPPLLAPLGGRCLFRAGQVPGEDTRSRSMCAASIAHSSSILGARGDFPA
jgi:hypothetical protein